MAPSAQYEERTLPIIGGHEKARTRAKKPYTYSGSLDSFQQINSTPIIGREILGLHIKDLLKSPDSDTQIRDLAITGTHFPCIHVPFEVIRIPISNLLMKFPNEASFS